MSNIVWGRLEPTIAEGFWGTSLILGGGWSMTSLQSLRRVSASVCQLRRELDPNFHTN